MAQVLQAHFPQMLSINAQAAGVGSHCCCSPKRLSLLTPTALPRLQTEAKEERAQRAGAKAAKAVGRSKSGREEREEAAKKSAMEELKAARERKARGAEER